MKDLGRIKERYDFSFDTRQLGLILLAVGAAAALVFVLGVSVGKQWERKTAVARPGAPSKAVTKPPVQQASLPVVPAAPPVTAPVLKPATTAQAPKEKPKDAQLTFPKVLTSNSKSTAPLAKEKEKEKEKVKEEAQAGSFTVQVGAYKTRSAAQASAGRLKKKGFEARVYDSGGKNGPYRFKLRVGRYTDREGARETARKLKSEESFTPFVTREE